MIGHIPELLEAGIDSLKVEGRMKTQLYVATVARTYRRAIDEYLRDPALYRENLPLYLEEIEKCTFREYTTGFYFGRPGPDGQIYDGSSYVRNYIYLGCVTGTEDGMALMEQKNKFCRGDVIELIRPDFNDAEAEVLAIYDAESGEEQESCPHARQRLKVRFSVPAEPGDILRVRAQDPA